MKVKSKHTDDFNLQSNRPRRPARFVMVLVVVSLAALAQLLIQGTPAAAVQPISGLVLIAPPLTTDPPIPPIPSDRFVITAPRGLDAQAIVAARLMIDEPIIHDPYRKHRSSSGAFRPARKLFRVKPIPPKPR